MSCPKLPCPDTCFFPLASSALPHHPAFQLFSSSEEFGSRRKGRTGRTSRRSNTALEDHRLRPEQQLYNFVRLLPSTGHLRRRCLSLSSSIPELGPELLHLLSHNLQARCLVFGIDGFHMAKKIPRVSTVFTTLWAVEHSKVLHRNAVVSASLHDQTLH